MPRAGVASPAVEALNEVPRLLGIEPPTLDGLNPCSFKRRAIFLSDSPVCQHYAQRGRLLPTIHQLNRATSLCICE